MFVVRRDKSNPILSPDLNTSWANKSAFNPNVIMEDGVRHVVFRAIGDTEYIKEGPSDFSVVGYGVERNGNVEEMRELITPSCEWDKYGCEDPRMTFVDGKYYIFYTAISKFPFSPEGIKVAVAITSDFITIEEKHLVTPFNAKAMALFPEKINGKYCVIFSYRTDLPPSLMCFALAEKLEDFWSESFWKEWEKERHLYTLDLRRGTEEHTEVGAVPVKTELGWLLVYSHMLHYYDGKGVVFGIEAVLLDLNEPRAVVGRSKSPIIVPEARYEKQGLIANVCFPSGAVVDRQMLDIYYGGADSFGCKASVRLSDLLLTITGAESHSVVRFANNPLRVPQKDSKWEELAVFNPGAIKIDETIYMIYRAMSLDNTSTVGLAISKNGYIFEYEKEPIYNPRGYFEEKHVPGGNSGCEDARIVEINGRIYITYTAYNGIDVPQIAIASIAKEDFVDKKWSNWSEPTIISPEGLDDKDCVLFPEKFERGYFLIHRINGVICGDYLEDLNFKPHIIDRCIEFLKGRSGMWDGKKVGVAGPPIKTEKGWILLYHGISEHSTYRVGAMLLDLNHPEKIISRCTDYIFGPEKDYELYGVVNNVVFPCGQVVVGDEVFLYYGGADKVLAGARFSLSNLLSALSL